MLPMLANLLLALLMTPLHGHSKYHHAKPGMYQPPPPPLSETKHFINMNLPPYPHKLPPPPPSVPSFNHLQSNRRKLLQDSGGEASGLEPQKVPHNWFGTDPYVAPKYVVELFLFIFFF